MQKDEAAKAEEKGKCEFHAGSFDGPLDLLLFLIQENKVDIYNIPVAEITEQFLSYIEGHKAEIAEIADFYHMASDLLYIKSRMLLPYEGPLDDEYEDPREELVERLIEYQKFKKYTDLLTGSAQNDRMYIPRKENPFNVPFEDTELFQGVTLEDLFRTFRNLLEKVSPAKVFNIYEEVTVKEKTALLLEMLEDRDLVTITELIVHPEIALHIICSFMAILEQCKDHTILIRQMEPNGEIYITRRPQDWDPGLAEEYDREYDRLLEGREELGDVEEGEAGDRVTGPENDDEEEEEIVQDTSGFVDDTLDEDYWNDDGEAGEEDIFIGEEEEISLEDDDD